MPNLRLSRIIAPSLFALLLCGGQSARAQEVAAASAARAEASDYSYILKPAEESGADAKKAPDAKADAAKADAPARPDSSEKPAAADDFVRGDAAGVEPFAASPEAAGAPQQTGAQPYTPLTSGQKMRRAFKSAFLSPQGYALSAFRAVLTQAGEEGLPDKEFEDEFGDWAARFARNVANRSTRTMFASGIYPVLFKQDPRYERAPKKGFLRRTGHAVSRVFVTRGDDGDLEPNYSRFAGVVTASALSNIWERSTPGHDRVGGDATLRRIARSFPNDMLFNVFREFLPDIIGIFRK